MKTCSRCHESKPVGEFSREAARSHLDGRHNYCKSCVAAYLREYRQQEPERFRRYEQERLERHGEERRERDRERWATRAAQEGATRARFARKMRKRFGITLEEYDAIVANPCQLCGSMKKVVLDHCHETGKIRGPLCHPCNVAIGQFGDDPERLRAAADYLEKHRVVAA